MTKKFTNWPRDHKYTYCVKRIDLSTLAEEEELVTCPMCLAGMLAENRLGLKYWKEQVKNSERDTTSRNYTIPADQLNFDDEYYLIVENHWQQNKVEGGPYSYNQLIDILKSYITDVVSQEVIIYRKVKKKDVFELLVGLGFYRATRERRGLAQQQKFDFDA